jgi:ParB family chromosome partitioning protein
MSATPRGLGRGLEALIPTAAAPVHSADVPRARSTADEEHLIGADDAGGGPAAYFSELPIESISANPRQPRAEFDEEELAELALSIAEVGLLQPVVVRRLVDDTYELVMGERRWRAARRAGMARIPAIVRHTPDDALLRDALLENLHRASLNPLEEAAAYQQLLDDFECTHDVLASRLGRLRPQISNTIRLLRLPAAVQRRVAAGVLSAGHARALLAVDDADMQERLAGRVVAEGISVRGLEELVAVGGTPVTATRTSRTREVPEDLVSIADRLAERLETRCSIAMGARRGRLTIEFASPEDLRRIMAAIDPQLLQ